MFLKKFFLNNFKKEKYQDIIKNINNFENKIKKLSDIQLKNKTLLFKEKILNGCTLEEILPEVFAVCREASKRILKMRHFDVQLMGGIVLHYGKIAEMGTGEGKTLMSTLTAYLNALSGKGVHIVTVNEYLAIRDFKLMKNLYNWLGINVSLNLSNFKYKLKNKSYNSDIIYGTNNEFGFDYLRDNIVYCKKYKVQKKLNFVIIDEVDSILIDEARVPLILSHSIENNINLCFKINNVLKELKICNDFLKKKYFFLKKKKFEGYYIKNKKKFQVWLTDLGYIKIENILIKIGLISERFSLYNNSNIIILYYIYASLRAHILYHVNKHYIIKNGLIVIVDEFTGRLTSERRWGDGLHQAIEAKEGLKIQSENQIIASITFQNYFRMYKKISGMTGTAATEAYEFKEIYNLETIVIPPNKKSIRKDFEDKIYITKKIKYKAIIKDINKCYNIGQPVLVCTISIKNSELISFILKKKNIPHNVLNAKFHKNEAYIISQAGKFKAITIATNMAGRGTDIILGGNFKNEIKIIKKNLNYSKKKKKKKIEKIKKNIKFLNKVVISLGGLKVISIERHESRRIDNQFKGRTARQGDPGSCCFYLSLEDPLIKIFCGNYIDNIINKFDFFKDELIQSRIITKSIELAQKKIEYLNFNIRKKILEYDDIINNQRKILYKERDVILNIKNVSKIIFLFIKQFFIKLFKKYVSSDSLKNKWNLLYIDNILNIELKINISLQNIYKKNLNITKKNLLNILLKKINFYLNKKIINLTKKKFNNFSKFLILKSIDFFWREYLFILEYLKQGIYLRGYIQKNPKREYKKESFKLFNKMLNLIEEEIIKIILGISIKDFNFFNKEKLGYNNNITYIYLRKKYFTYSIYDK
ncbi:preprotein translocase subunit SecA [Candidatus Zinderia endosymbiont of Aphrophora alni]|uniref:preprotein translocase subunit SecA n=1 Tax=Candidatus Zinderia endosymbiont of Aphrophora alni TaxID=3077951 RepID=UPI0030D60E06